MTGTRTRHSLAQLLELQELVIPIALFSKYGVQRVSLGQGQLLYGLLNMVRDLGDGTLMHVLAEVVATQGDLRARVNPKYRFDERMHDLKQCLLLDGYAVQDARLVQIDPLIEGSAPLEDVWLSPCRLPARRVPPTSSPRLQTRPIPFVRRRPTTTLPL